MKLNRLEQAFNEGDFSKIFSELKKLCKNTTMTFVADQSGLGRESLYKALSGSVDMRFSTVLKIMKALNIKFSLDLEEAKATKSLSSFRILQAKRRCQLAEKRLISAKRDLESLDPDKPQ